MNIRHQDLSDMRVGNYESDFRDGTMKLRQYLYGREIRCRNVWCQECGGLKGDHKEGCSKYAPNEIK